MLTLLLLAVQPSDQLQIDPLLVRQAAEVWTVVASAENPVWPGWNASTTPILIYLPGKQDLLINHPNPPQGFVAYAGPVRFPGATMHVKSGPTLIDFDGQNTARDINGVQTLVVADTLSNRRQELEGLAAQAKSTSNLGSAIDGILRPRPIDSMLMFAHEAFHVYQHEKSKKGGNELALLTYPALSAENNAGYVLEAEALAAAVRSQDPKSDAIRWLAIREARRRHLTPAQVAYEDGTEFNEGLAKYVEWRLLEALRDRKPHAEMWLVQGFSGYTDVDGNQGRLLNQMKGFMSGTTNVNNDPYGASPVRMRLYYSGMAIGALLDRLGADWKAKIMGEATLTSLVRDQLSVSADALDDAWRRESESGHYRTTLTSKQDLAQRGEAHISEVLASFDNAPASLTIDYSALEKPRVGYSFTPFGILRIDDDRRVFRLIPLRGLIGSLTFSEDGPRPVLDDGRAKRVRFVLTADPQNLPTGNLKEAKVELPGVSLANVTGTFRREGNHVVLTLSG